MLGDVLSVTIVGAEYPVNLGYTARLMKNFGLRRLYLVDSNCDMRAASVYASHGADVLEEARSVTLARVRRTHDLLVATTAIKARRGANVNRTVTRPEEVVARAVTSQSASLVFGRDTTGLMNHELAICDLVTSLDTGTGYRTLNVSHSAAILLYLISRAWAKRGQRRQALGAERGEREAFARYAHQLAVSSGMQTHRAERVFLTARRVAVKSDISSKELRLLISLMRGAEARIRRTQR